MRQTIQVDVLTTDEATVAEVQGTTYAESYRGGLKATGYAKKHPNDEHDAEVGHALAMARALKTLAEAYEKRAWERISHPTVPKDNSDFWDSLRIGIPRTYEISGKLTDPSWTNRK